jgi:hypothetical protein
MPEDNPVRYRKIIRPCDTRWNSQFMCLQSIYQLKDALLKLKFQPRDADLVPLIPDEAEFEVIQSLLPPLKELKTISETLSSDTKPTLHMVVPLLFNVQNLDKMFPLCGQEVTDFLKKVSAEVENRMPNLGKDNDLYATACFLHPRFMGSVLKIKDTDTFERVKRQLIETHPSYIDMVRSAQGPSGQGSVDLFASQDLNTALSETRWNLLESLAEEESVSRPNPDQKSPIELEITRFLELTPKASSADVDVLAWWKAQASHLPLLAEIARKILAYPASSSSSERIFSTGGDVVTAKRMNLDPGSVERLVFYHDNWQKLTVKNWDTGFKQPTGEEDEGEAEAEEEEQEQEEEDDV